MQLPETLEPEARFAVELLRRLHRQWEDNPNVQWQEPEHAKLSIRVPSPCARPDGDLVLDLHGGEFIVFFAGPFHTHFEFEPNDPMFGVQVVILCRFLDSLLAERIAVAHCYRAGEWAGSTIVELADSGQLTPRSGRDLQEFATRAGATGTRIRTWLGTFDHEETIDGTA